MARAAIRHRLSGLLRSPYLVVVPLFEGTVTQQAVDVASRLADDHKSCVLLIAPLFVELELPLDAHFAKEEAALRGELERERAVVASYGVASKGRIVRTRHGQLGPDVAAAASEASAALIVLGAPIESRRGFRAPFSRDVWSVIQDAPCPILIATEPAKPIRAA